MYGIWYIPRPPSVALFRALWYLLDGTWGVLKGSWGVLVVYGISYIIDCIWCIWYVLGP